ncbi:hypothetical protein [Halorarum halobium]|uniref:hypothetical protein n=1 Tax=Halorarum halobium TaxID=3075121 RepID=UPI0028A5AAFD|nr:hypothetical protein [Halobaculum sp. XH14]
MTDGSDTLADVSHVHPETSETFWDVYRRGPAMADGGERRARRNGTSSASTAGTGEDGRGGAGGGRGTAADGTLADVSHDPPYEETNRVWTRGVERPGDGGSSDEWSGDGGSSDEWSGDEGSGDGGADG